MPKVALLTSCSFVASLFEQAQESQEGQWRRKGGQRRLNSCLYSTKNAPKFSRRITYLVVHYTMYNVYIYIAQKISFTMVFVWSRKLELEPINVHRPDSSISLHFCGNATPLLEKLHKKHACFMHVPHAWMFHGTCMEHAWNMCEIGMFSCMWHAWTMHAPWMAFMPWMYHAWTMHAWSGCWTSILLCSSFLYRSLHVRSTSWKLY